MSWKFYAGHLLILSLLFSSCSPVSSPEGQGWPDDDDIATMISITLTHLADVQPQDTPQPADLGSENQESQDQSAEVAEGADNQAAESTEEQDQAQDSPDDVDDGRSQSSSQGNTGGDQSVEGDEQSAGQGGIPGLIAIDLVSRLVEFGFDCPAPQDQVDPFQLQCTFETEDFRFEVAIWGTGIDQIDLVEATAFYFGDLDYTGLTTVVFEGVAEMPYEGSQPEEAKEWVNAHLAEVLQIGDEAVMDFGGVRYYLYALPSMQVLEIGQRTE